MIFLKKFIVNFPNNNALANLIQKNLEIKFNVLHKINKKIVKEIQ